MSCRVLAVLAVLGLGFGPGFRRSVGVPAHVGRGQVNIEVDVMSKYVERSMMGLSERIDRLEEKLDALASKLH